MKIHIEYIKPVFENLFQELIKRFILDLIPSIVFPTQSIDVTAILTKVKSNYQFGTYIGIWTKNGVYRDIIVKIFKRLSENKDELIKICKNYYDLTYDLKLSQIDHSNRTTDIVKHLLKIIDLQALGKKEVKLFSVRESLSGYFSSNENSFLIKLRKIMEGL